MFPGMITETTYSARRQATRYVVDYLGRHFEFEISDRERSINLDSLKKKQQEIHDDQMQRILQRGDAS